MKYKGQKDVNNNNNVVWSLFYVRSWIYDNGGRYIWTNSCYPRNFAWIQVKRLQACKHTQNLAWAFKCILGQFCDAHSNGYLIDFPGSQQGQGNPCFCGWLPTSSQLADGKTPPPQAMDIACDIPMHWCHAEMMSACQGCRTAVT